jgi:hypothetical protein
VGSIDLALGAGNQPIDVESPAAVPRLQMRFWLLFPEVLYPLIDLITPEANEAVNLHTRDLPPRSPGVQGRALDVKVFRELANVHEEIRHRHTPQNKKARTKSGESNLLSTLSILAFTYSNPDARIRRDYLAEFWIEPCFLFLLL